MELKGNYIDGHWLVGGGKKEIKIFNPATGDLIKSVVAADKDDVNSAAEAADKSFSGWKLTTPFHRGQLIRQSASLVEENSESIARLMSLEQGKPFKEALGEVKKGVDIFNYYADEGERVSGRIIPSNERDVRSSVLYEPVGPSAAISPWNYPIELLSWKVAAALAAGCTIVCKLPSEAPLAPLAFFSAVLEAGYPDGVINVLTGEGSDIGTALVKHPCIKKIAFTGSTSVGRKIALEAAYGLKKVSLELGGSLPFLVFDDCDLRAAAKGATRRSFRNMGQICIAVNRVYVQRKVYDKFLDMFIEETKKLKIGHGATDLCDLGAMCTHGGLRKTMHHIDNAVELGGRLVLGGKAPADRKYSSGLFFEPTIIADANHDMLVMQDETFGPVVGVMPFDSLEEALVLANDSPYGLAAIAYTSNLYTANRVIEGLDVGNVAINNPDPGVINAPYGGRKESGYGYEHGREGLFEYLNIKHVRLKSL